MKLTRILTTVDTHTAGGPTRTVVAGLPPLTGTGVAEKMEHFRVHHDGLRRLLMHEPRGHRDMSGAVVTDPTGPGADIAVFFLTADGYLPACVHSSIGVVTAGLQLGFIAPGDRADGAVLMETPSGRITLLPRWEGGAVESVALRPAAAFTWSASERLDVGDGLCLEVALAWSGVFFVLIDIGQLDLAPCASGSPIGPENVAYFTALGRRTLAAAKAAFQVEHPSRPGGAPVALAMFHHEVGPGHGRDIVVGPSGSVDRSPCGAGTAAKVALLFTQGRLPLGEVYVNESFLGTRFLGRALEPARVGPFAGALPEVRGSAFVTGMHQFVLQEGDPLPEGLYF